MANDFVVFLWGAFACAAIAISFAFGRMQLQTGDRFFGWFSAAFALLGLERIVAVLVVPRSDETTSPALYLLRLVAFVFILVAITLKNRRPR